MNRPPLVVSLLVGTLVLTTFASLRAQSRITPDLGGLADARSLNAFNRATTRLDEGNRHGVRVTAAAGEGVVFIPNVEFSYGTIEFDVRGKDVAQQSFVAVAFHGVDGSIHDAVYFRPFNFKAADPTARGHAVQYHSLPQYTWQKLRTEQPGKYEHTVEPVPEPNDWFHVRLVVANPQVSVFVNNGAEPCLTVNLLNDRRKGLVGLWVGNTSGGDFANVAITRAAD